MKIKIGLGGGCHWCTEAIFQSLKGVTNVEQGWVSADSDPSFSEAVIVHFDPDKITLATLVEIHLHTHSSTSNHRMRGKYRSAVYVFSPAQKKEAESLLALFRADFDKPLITQVYGFLDFRASSQKYRDYYSKNPDFPFCQTYINPKIQKLKAGFPRHTKQV